MSVEAEPLCPRLLIGVCGSINAAALQGYLTSLSKEVCGEIRIILTQSALNFCSPLTLTQYTHSRVFTDTDELDAAWHLELADWADVFLVLPATANTLAKAAAGIADSLLTTTLLAHEHPIIFGPVMNTRMWQNSTVRRNVQTLRGLGHDVIQPTAVTAISDPTSEGRAPTPSQVLQHVQRARMRTLHATVWDSAIDETSAKADPPLPEPVPVQITPGVKPKP